MRNSWEESRWKGNRKDKNGESEEEEKEDYSMESELIK